MSKNLARAVAGIAVITFIAGAGVAVLAVPGEATTRPGSVIVLNDEASPVPVDVMGTPLPVTLQQDEPIAVTSGGDSRLAVQRRHTIELQSGSSEDLQATLYLVPAGKRLVVEYVSASAMLVDPGPPDAVSTARVRVTATGAGGTAAADVPLFESPRIAGSRGLAGSERVVLYGDAESTVRVTVEARTTGGTRGHVDVSIAGYLVDAA
jgi:hypothetical protein